MFPLFYAMAPTALQNAVTNRIVQKSEIARLENNATKPGISINSIDLLLKKLEALEKKAEETQVLILHHCDAADVPKYSQEHTDMMDDIEKIMLQLLQEKAALMPPPAGTSAGPLADVKLPKLELPKFDGNLNNWLHFRDAYISSVHNNASLSNSQKFNYLQGSLIGEAAQLTKSMTISDANYLIAWKSVQERYQCERDLGYAIMLRMFNQPSINSESGTALRSLVDTTRECMRSLEVLHVDIDKCSPLLGFIVLQKLDKTTRQAYDLTLADNDFPAVTDMLKYLDTRSRSMLKNQKPTSTESSKPTNDRFKKKVHLHHLDTQVCKVCKGSHQHYKCATFLAMPPADRHALVRKLSLCYNCLSDGHSINKCNSKKSCQTCKKRHHTLIHLDRQSSSSTPNESTSVTTYHTVEKSQNQSQGFLATARFEFLTTTIIHKYSEHF